MRVYIITQDVASILRRYVQLLDGWDHVSRIISCVGIVECLFGWEKENIVQRIFGVF